MKKGSSALSGVLHAGLIGEHEKSRKENAERERKMLLGLCNYQNSKGTRVMAGAKENDEQLRKV